MGIDRVILGKSPSSIGNVTYEGNPPTTTGGWSAADGTYGGPAPTLQNETDYMRITCTATRSDNDGYFVYIPASLNGTAVVNIPTVRMKIRKSIGGAVSVNWKGKVWWCTTSAPDWTSFTFPEPDWERDGSLGPTAGYSDLVFDMSKKWGAEGALYKGTFGDPAAMTFAFGQDEGDAWDISEVVFDDGSATNYRTGKTGLFVSKPTKNVMSCSDGDLIFDSTAPDFMQVMAKGTDVVPKATIVDDNMVPSILKIETNIKNPHPEENSTVLVRWNILSGASNVHPIAYSASWNVPDSQSYVTAPPYLNLDHLNLTSPEKTGTMPGFSFNARTVSHRGEIIESAPVALENANPGDGRAMPDFKKSPKYFSDGLGPGESSGFGKRYVLWSNTSHIWYTYSDGSIDSPAGIGPVPIGKHMVFDSTVEYAHDGRRYTNPQHTYESEFAYHAHPDIAQDFIADTISGNPSLYSDWPHPPNTAFNPWHYIENIDNPVWKNNEYNVWDIVFTANPVGSPNDKYIYRTTKASAYDMTIPARVSYGHTHAWPSWSSAGNIPGDPASPPAENITYVKSSYSILDAVNQYGEPLEDDDNVATHRLNTLAVRRVKIGYTQQSSPIPGETPGPSQQVSYSGSDGWNTQAIPPYSWYDNEDIIPEITDIDVWTASENESISHPEFGPGIWHFFNSAYYESPIGSGNIILKNPAVSNSIAFTLKSGDGSGLGRIMIIDNFREVPVVPRQISPPHLNCSRPKWCPDGMKILFTAWEGTPDSRIWVVDADGHNPYAASELSLAAPANTATWANAAIIVSDYNGGSETDVSSYAPDKNTIDIIFTNGSPHKDQTVAWTLYRTKGV